MQPKKKEIKLTRAGILLGSTVPIIATLFDFVWSQLPPTVNNLILLYKRDPLLWIILTTPIAIGMVFHYFDKRVKSHENELIEDRNKNHEELNKLEEFIFHVDSGDFRDRQFNFNDQRLAGLLASLKGKLVRQKDEDEKAKWAAEGHAKFGEIFRSTNDLNLLADKVVKNLVHITGSNQASVFILNEKDKKNPSLELTSCYAYERKKYETKTIDPGEGLVGQCYLENDTIVLTQVPPNYTKITSGLGQATPDFIVIVPIKTDDKTEGVLEMAAFKKFPADHIKFIEKVCEGFASVISSAKVSEETKHLLAETQNQTEELRAQEEEMRQNMEELHATQEAMERKSRESDEQREADQKAKLEAAKVHEEELRQNVEELKATQEQMAGQLEETKTMRHLAETREAVLELTTILSETDTRGVITFVNKKFCELSKYKSEELIGKPQNIVRHPDMPKELFRLFWETIKKGEVFQGIIKNRAKDGSSYWVDATIVPIKDGNGKVIKFIGARYHIKDEAIALELYNRQADLHNWPPIQKMVLSFN